MSGGSVWPFMLGCFGIAAAIPLMGFVGYRRDRIDHPDIRGPVLAGTGLVTKVELSDASNDQRDWYRVTVRLTIPELPDSGLLEAPARRFEFEPNDRPVVGDIWQVEASATHPSRYRVVAFPARRDSSRGAQRPSARTSGPALDSRKGEWKVPRGPVRIGSAQALKVQRSRRNNPEGQDLYDYVITFRVKTPGYAPYDVIRTYRSTPLRNAINHRPYEGDAWEVQVSESDHLNFAVLFDRPVLTQM